LLVRGDERILDPEEEVVTKALLVALVAFSALGQAPAALGGTVSLSGRTLTYDASAGQVNHVYIVAVSSHSFRVVDVTAPVTAGVGCTQVSNAEASCANPPHSLELNISLGDMDDFIKVSEFVGYTRAFIDGGAGDDGLEGGFGENILDGGSGADTFHAASEIRDVVDYSNRIAPVTVTVGDGLPNDGEPGEGDLIPGSGFEVRGGQAEDVLSSTADETTLSGGPGNDTITFQQTFDPGAFGGPGDDSITFSGSTLDTRIHGNAGDDVITASGPGSFQVMFGDAGADTLDGGGGHDVIHGGAGDDRLVGGAGRDYLAGGPDADTIFARDGRRDRVHGQDGHDRARVDHLDRVSDVEEFF
jgi:hypothetical protein